MGGAVKASGEVVNNNGNDGKTLNGMTTLNRHPKPMTVSTMLCCFALGVKHVLKLCNNFCIKLDSVEETLKCDHSNESC